MDTTRNLKQTIVWWEKTGRDGFGKPIIGDPIEISGRWEPTLKKVVSNNGEEITLEASVLVDRDISVGDWLYEGTLAELSSGEEAIPFSFAKEVIFFERTPDIKGTTFERSAWVK